MFKKKIHHMKTREGIPSHTQKLDSDYFNHHSRQKNSPYSGCCLVNHRSSFIKEFLCHLPMSILALCVSLLFIVFFDGSFRNLISLSVKQGIYNDLFHVSHYIHILFSSFASFFVFRTLFVFKHIFWGILISLLNSFVFCTLADIILPAIGGYFLGYDVELHLCFLHIKDLSNVACFAFFGIFAAYCLSKGDKKFGMLVAEKVHLGHVWTGCIASLLYLLSQVNIVHWADEVGFLLIILFFSVVIPCVFSDFCVPFLFSAASGKKNEFQDTRVDFY